VKHSSDGHEGSKPIRKAKIDMFEGQLNRFALFDDETPQDMFNRLKSWSIRQRHWGPRSGPNTC
jgi:hypothetical protein